MTGIFRECAGLGRRAGSVWARAGGRAVGALVLLAALPAAAEETNHVAFEALNEAFGAAFWADESLWDDDADDAAKRLKWREESRTTAQASYRNYTGEKDRVLGARPYSVAMYAEEGRPRQVSMIFANMGDYAGDFVREDLAAVTDRKKWAETRAKARKEARASFEDALERDEAAILGSLTNLLGAPVKDRFGQGQDMRERVQRWDWNGHAILLAAPRGEYVGVRILPVALADSEGRTEAVKDSEMRKALASRVARRDNGDVVVTEIPMVDQGPKGFCVPATWERYLRYLGIPADMYLLALAGNTGFGGGTHSGSMAAAVEDVVKRNRRRMDRVKASFRAKDLADYIDDGLPLMWALSVDMRTYRDVSLRTAERAKAADWKAWAKSLEPVREAAGDIRKNADTAHYCMVIGYNAETEEVATSDSWGPEFAERWMTFEEAEAMSLGEMRIVRW